MVKINKILEKKRNLCPKEELEVSKRPWYNRRTCLWGLQVGTPFRLCVV